MPTHYEILGVSKDADETAIKKAYRKLSLQYHPDRNGGDPAATEKYKAINEAHEILSDTQKREQYDAELQFGPGGGFPGGGFPGGGFPGGGPGGMNDFFNMMFGGGFPGMGPMGGGPGIRVFHSNGSGGMEHIFQQLNKPQPIHKTVCISFEQAYHGTTVKVDIERQIIKENSRYIENLEMNINIPAGVDENETMTIEGQGHSVMDGQIRGDIKLDFKIENNTIFKRSGQDLVYSRSISLKEALCGFAFEIQHISGKTLNMNNTQNPTIVKPGFKKVVPGLGFNKGGQTGNLVIELSVDFPDTLTEEQINSLRDIL